MKLQDLLVEKLISMGDVSAFKRKVEQRLKLIHRATAGTNYEDDAIKIEKLIDRAALLMKQKKMPFLIMTVLEKANELADKVINRMIMHKPHQKGRAPAKRFSLR